MFVRRNTETEIMALMPQVLTLLSQRLQPKVYTVGPRATQP